MVKPDDLLLLASSLLETAQQEADPQSEAFTRAAASRAYYAAYHAVEPIGRKLPQRTDTGQHQRLIESLLSVSPRGQSGVFSAEAARKMQSLGHQLQLIKKLRSDADYQLTQEFSQPEADQVIQTAKKMLEKAEQVEFS